MVIKREKRSDQELTSQLPFQIMPLHDEGLLFSLRTTSAPRATGGAPSMAGPLSLCYIVKQLEMLQIFWPCSQRFRLCVQKQTLKCTTLKHSNLRDLTGIRLCISQICGLCTSPLFSVWLKMMMGVSHLSGGGDGQFSTFYLPPQAGRGVSLIHFLCFEGFPLQVRRLVLEGAMGISLKICNVWRFCRGA